MLEPGSTVGKDDDYNFVIDETGKMKLSSRKVDFAKLGTKAEKETPLKIYAKRRPKEPSGRVTKDKIMKNASNLRQKLVGDKKIGRRIKPDGTTAFASVKTNESRVLLLRKPVKKLHAPSPRQQKS